MHKALGGLNKNPINNHMQKIKAKFLCTGVVDHPAGQQKSVSFTPVISGSDENKSFAKYTPSGSLHLSVSYETLAAEAFVEGNEYYLDIYPCTSQHETELVSFGTALEALKEGKRAARVGWNGKGMFIFMRPADEIRIDIVVNNIKSLPKSVKDYYAQDIQNEDGDQLKPEFIDENDTVMFTAYLCMKAADGVIVNGWLASQTDMLSNDWIILD